MVMVVAMFLITGTGGNRNAKVRVNMIHVIIY